MFRSKQKKKVGVGFRISEVDSALPLLFESIFVLRAIRVKTKGPQGNRENAQSDDLSSRAINCRKIP
jgi:hypothetical protein